MPGTPQRTLLLMDGEARGLEPVATAWRRAGHTTVEATDASAGLRLLFNTRPDAVLLDLGVAGLDGWRVLERIRDLTDVPLILLTDGHSPTETVRALDAGADDVLVKPVASDEVLARVTALLRRSPPVTDRSAPYADARLVLDPATRRVDADGAECVLTPTEFRLLEVLVRNADIVLTPTQLLELVWHDLVGTGDGSVKTAVLRLRRKLGWEDPATSPIQSVRGVGYRYRPDGLAPVR